MGDTNRLVGGVKVPENERRCLASAAQSDWFSDEDEDFRLFSRRLCQETGVPCVCVTRDRPIGCADDGDRFLRAQLRERDETDRAWRAHQGKDIPIPEPCETEPPEKSAWLEGTITLP